MALERVKQNFDFVEDYTVSETTLEQVFLSFAKAQSVNLWPRYSTGIPVNISCIIKGLSS